MHWHNLYGDFQLRTCVADGIAPADAFLRRYNMLITATLSDDAVSSLGAPLSVFSDHDPASFPRYLGKKYEVVRYAFHSFSWGEIGRH